jgi:hypothetical protein
MLSTKPMGGGGGGAGPMSGGGMGGQGMPEPRKLSGQARQDRETDPGTYVVRLSYNDLAAKPGTPEGPPAGVPVFLVGYASDDTVIVKTEKSDAMGRVAFPKLDMTGNVGYFSLANLPRGAGVDRRGVGVIAAAAAAGGGQGEQERGGEAGAVKHQAAPS